MKKIKKYIVVKLALSFSLLSIVTMAAAVSAAQQLCDLLKRSSTYTADFKQLTYNDRGKLMQASQGQLMIARPGKFRWETQRPLKQIIIANGKTLWIYNVSLAQATKQPISSRGGVDPAALLSGNTTQLIREFKVTRLSGEGKNFQLKSRNSTSVFQLVHMRFNQKNQLVRIKVVNNLGQTSLFSFSRIRLNRKLSPKLFQFKPPRGVDILKQS